jgi:ABC-type multidrug transport system ATPase subunit
MACVGLGEQTQKKTGKYSRGMRQRLGLADVLIKDPEIIILDEPSGALDPIAEYTLNKTVTELSSDKTVIIISHRLSTTRFADKIYMLLAVPVALIIYNFAILYVVWRNKS